MKSNTAKYKEIIIPIITKHLPHTKIILYGSRARGTDKPGSDIDIALDTGAQIDDRVLSAIVYDLEESDLPITFDLIDLHAVAKEMKHEVLKDGIIW